MRSIKPITFVFGICAAICLFIIVAPVMFNDSFNVNRQRQWIQNAVAEMANLPMPTLNTNLIGHEVAWILPQALVFSNGWAAYKTHTIHEGNDVGDVAVLRTSDGLFYVSHTHFCAGITGLMEPSPYDEEPCAQPADAGNFLAGVGRFQGWNLASQDNRLWCVINLAREPRYSPGKKPFWVWITKGKGTNQVTLVDRRYVVTGNYVSWSTHWLTNDGLVIDVYDYGKDRTPRIYPESVKSNHITSLTFQWDKQTDKFVEKD